MEYVYKKEKPLFILSLIFSLLVWLAVLVGTKGVLLLGLLIIFLGYLVLHSGFISYLKGNAIRVTEDQYPDLYRMHLESCEKLKLGKAPELYLLCSDGILNALATRFLRKDFVALYSGVVDALEERPEAVRFYIGHELGHIAQSHLLYWPLLFPASILPLLGAAYARARESTCDLHGLACANSPEDAMYAMAVLAAGERRWRDINFAPYLEQVAMTSDFWMSFHELIADYPWLSKRMARVQAAADQHPVKLPRRHGLAWLLALFIPRTGIGSSVGNIMIVGAIIVIVVVNAVPQYRNHIQRVKVMSAWEVGLQAQTRLEEYILENGSLPESLAKIGFDSGSAQVPANYELNEQGGIVITFTGAGPLAEKTLIIQPYVENNQLYWRCDLGTLSPALRPGPCRSAE